MDIEPEDFGQVRNYGSVRAVSNNDRLVKFRLSDDRLDRVGTRVMASGIDTEAYDQNPVFLWAHDSGGLFNSPRVDSVIGRTVEHSVTRLERATNGASEAFDITVEFATKDVNPQAEVAFQLVKKGFLNATSIGFRPRMAERRRQRDDTGRERDVLVFTRSELLEASLVPVPANPGAIALARSLVSEYSETIALPALGDEAVKRWVQGHNIGGDAPKRQSDGEPQSSSLITEMRGRFFAKTNGSAIAEALRHLNEGKKQ